MHNFARNIAQSWGLPNRQSNARIEFGYIIVYLGVAIYILFIYTIYLHIITHAYAHKHTHHTYICISMHIRHLYKWTHPTRTNARISTRYIHFKMLCYRAIIACACRMCMLNDASEQINRCSGLIPDLDQANPCNVVTIWNRGNSCGHLKDWTLPQPLQIWSNKHII